MKSADLTHWNGGSLTVDAGRKSYRMESQVQHSLDQSRDDGRHASFRRVLVRRYRILELLACRVTTIEFDHAAMTHKTDNAQHGRNCETDNARIRRPRHGDESLCRSLSREHESATVSYLNYREYEKVIYFQVIRYLSRSKYVVKILIQRATLLKYWHLWERYYHVSFRRKLDRDFC